MSDDTGSGGNGVWQQFTPEAGRKAVFVRERMRQWRKDNPDAPLTPSEKKKLVRQQILEGIPEVIDSMFEVATDPDHSDFGATSRALLDHAIGKPPPADVEIDANEIQLINRPDGL